MKTKYRNRIFTGRIAEIFSKKSGAIEVIDYEEKPAKKKAEKPAKPKKVKKNG